MRHITHSDALIVVDVQNCFCPGGSLGVEEGDRVIPVVNRLVPLFSHHVYSRDWHPPEHVSFAEPPEFRDGSWPSHCVQNTPDAEFHPNLDVPAGALVIGKATDPEREEYSAFESKDVDLAGWLRERAVDHVYVTGLATDYCVRSTTLDALAAGFSVTVVEDAVRGVAPDTSAAALREMLDAGAELLPSEEIAGLRGTENVTQRQRERASAPKAAIKDPSAARAEDRVRDATEVDSSRRWAARENLALLTDFYELTMLGGYWKTGRFDAHASFEYTFRELPPDTGFAVTAGLEQLLDLVEGLRFTRDDIEYLESLGAFDPEFLSRLETFHPRVSIWAAPEGTVVFPHEPLVRVEGPLPDVQVIETALLNALNYPTLVATKTARVCLAANGDTVIEFGLRRAQGPDGGLSGSRASYIGGAHGTSNVLAGKLYGIPVRGTHAHSWVMSFDSELTAFRAYAAMYPEDCLLLVDTFDTLTSGLPNALTVFKELRASGHEVRAAIRLDSGDLARLSKIAYRMFTEAGFADPLIVASNELDEDLIADLKRQGARINSWGVGTKLITSSSWPALGGVYKLIAIRGARGGWKPRIKVSSNPTKMTDPGRKQVIRYRDADGRPLVDVMYTMEEQPHAGPDIYYVGRQELGFLTCVDGASSYEQLLEPVMVDGKRVGSRPSLWAIRERGLAQIAALPDELRRLRNPEIYPVGLSPELADLKATMIHEATGKPTPHDVLPPHG